MNFLIFLGVVIGLLILIKTGILGAIFSVLGTIGHVILVGLGVFIIFMILYNVLKFFGFDIFACGI